MGYETQLDLSLKHRVQKIAWCAIIYHGWPELSMHVHGAILRPPQVISQTIWSEISICCSKWLGVSLAETQMSSSPWDFFP